jgi:TonB-dependent starch-binding outer membrane protein SusC
MKLKLLFGALLFLSLLQTELKAYPSDMPKPEARRFIAISGHITAPTGEGIPGVSVVLKGTTTGTISDIDGFYNLNAPEKEGTLLFSFVGYKTQEVPFKSTPVIDIILEAAENSLDEVVVVGYGTAKKGNIANAVSSMSAQDLEDRPLNRIENALSGQMAGVYAQTTSGEPGAELQVRVRGTGSINASNEPLYVVDGVPVDNLRGINPNDVQSLDVLKDASAAAIYGSRGSNGVVIVTTKKGKKGKPKLRFNSYIGFQNIESQLDMMSPEQWIQHRKEGVDEAWVNRGVSLKKDYKASDSQEFRAAELAITLATPNTSLMYDPKWATPSDSLGYVDWQTEITRPATMKYYELGATGGTDDLTYNISTSFLDHDGIVIETNLKRANLRANFEAKIARRFKFGLTLAPSSECSNAGRVDGKDNTALVAIQMPPVVNKEAGKYTGAMPFGAYPWSGRYFNPIATMERTDFSVKRNRLNSNAYLHVDLIKGMQLQFMGAMDNTNYLDQRFTPTSAQRDWATIIEGASTTAQRNQSWTNRYLFQSTLSYKKSLNKVHNLDGLLGYSAELTSFENSFQSASGFPNDWSPIFSNTSVKSTGTNITAGSTALLSYFGRLGYNFKEKYIFSGTIRRDGSSKFGLNKRWGVFPAFSAAWRLSDEGFIKKIKLISDLKLRASWGVTGNNRIPDNAQFSLLGTQNYALNGVSISGFSPVTIENLDLGWEQTASKNFGLDFGLLGNRFLGSVDIYNRKTSALLLRTPISALSGFPNSWQNVGNVENKGVEFSITTRNVVSKTQGFTWRTNFNVSFNKNTVLKLGADDTPIPGGFSDLTHITQVGAPINSMILYQHIGVYMNEGELSSFPKSATNKIGDSRYRDVNGDGIISAADRTISGKSQPDYIFGFNNDFSYKNFDLRIVTFAQQGGNIYSMIGRSIDRPGMGYLYNKLAIWKDRWQSTSNPGNGWVPSINATTGSFYDTRWLYSSDYIRIKNITLGYNLPKIKGLDRAKVYASFENAFIWHKYDGGWTPEAANDAGGDYGGYPQAKTATLGVNVTF